MEREDNEDKHVRIVIDRRNASRRLADYLRRERFVPEGDVDRRAGEMMDLVGSDGDLALGGALLGAADAGALVRNWWLFALRGVLAIIFGLLALWQPLAALGAFVLVFGVWAFIDGIHALALAVTGWRSWQLVVAGLVGIALGVFTFFRPGITALGLYAAVAAWAIARGVLEIAVAIELRKQVKGEVWLVLGAIASIVFGVLMVALPVAGVLALAWLIALYALTFGVIMLVLAARLWRLRRPAEARPIPIHVNRPQPA